MQLICPNFHTTEGNLGDECKEICQARPYHPHDNSTKECGEPMGIIFKPKDRVVTEHGVGTIKQVEMVKDYNFPSKGKKPFKSLGLGTCWAVRLDKPWSGRLVWYYWDRELKLEAL